MNQSFQKREGFTLIELLAVIVILAVIALIATPLILNVIERAEKGAFKDSAYGIMEAAEFQVLLDNTKYPITYVFPDDSARIKFKGTKPTEGYIQIIKEGKIRLALGNGRWCAVKDVNESQVTVKNGECDKSEIQKPIMSGYGDLNQEINVNETYTMPNVTATDKDGNSLNVTTVIQREGTVVDSIDTSKKGIYTVTYTTEPDKDGNTSTVTVTITVIKQDTDTDKIIEDGLKEGNGLEKIGDIYYYRGSNPKNYIMFNAEKWRILKIENGRMKLIRNDVISRIAWDTANSNDWNRPATIRTYLNETYYNTLSETAKQQIEVSTFYTGTINWNRTTTLTTVIANEKTNSWVGKVGLMNVSDYAYAAVSESSNADSCVNKPLENYQNCSNNWLNIPNYEWTINASSDNLVAYVDLAGGLYSYICSNNSGNYVANTIDARPVVTLKANVKIVSGDGTIDSPYLIQSE